MTLFTCAYCFKKIPENQPLHALDVKFAEGIDFTDKEGEIVPIYFHLRKKSSPMIVTTADSEAKKKGQDGLFPLCSRSCGENMKALLAKAKDTFE